MPTRLWPMEALGYRLASSRYLVSQMLKGFGGGNKDIRISSDASPNPSSSHPIQNTSFQALAVAEAQAQAMREFLTALELSQVTGACGYHE